MRSKTRKPLTDEERAALLGIRERIEMGGWSLRQMAKKIGIDPSSMTRIFQEMRGMDFFEFVRISLALGKDPRDFLGELRFTVPPKSQDEVIAEKLDESLTDEQFKLLEKRRKARKKTGKR